jgi:hypothetical protein
MSTSSAGKPQYNANLRNYSMTTLTLLSPLKKILLPAIRPPKICKHGISRGKLNGDTTAQEP